SRIAQHRAHVPAAGGVGRVAGVLLRSERRALEAGFRAQRAAAARGREGVMTRPSDATASSSQHRTPPEIAPDHLVVAAATLTAGCDFIEERLGVRPRPAGKHPAMGTHNALLRAGPRLFLEVIAIDPG